MQYKNKGPPKQSSIVRQTGIYFFFAKLITTHTAIRIVAIVSVISLCKTRLSTVKIKAMTNNTFNIVSFFIQSHSFIKFRFIM